MNGYTVEYSVDGNKVWIIPQNWIDFDDMEMVLRHLYNKGYKYWLPSEKDAYVFVKKIGGADPT